MMGIGMVGGMMDVSLRYMGGITRLQGGDDERS
jgi:hypothetical protein